MPYSTISHGDMVISLAKHDAERKMNEDNSTLVSFTIIQFLFKQQSSYKNKIKFMAVTEKQF